MKKTEMFVTVYRLQVEATLKDLNSMDDFVEAISDCAIVSNEEGCLLYTSPSPRD